MKLINSSFEILEQKPGLEGIYEAIEVAGRTCYKSERPEGKTAKDFVDMLIKRGHLSPLEHGTVYLLIEDYNYIANKYIDNPYSKLTKITESGYQGNFGSTYNYITTNYRVLYENNWLDDLKYLCEPTEYHEKRVGVRVNCSIGISREWNRHRALTTTEDVKSDLEFSVCEQSTRYCNYSKDKFGNEITFVIPSWVTDIKPGKYIGNEHLEYLPSMWEHDNLAQSRWFQACKYADMDYYLITDSGCTPQQAREVLPLSTATEVVYTGFTNDWEHFFQMRCDNAAHPDIRKLAIPLKEEFIKRGYIE